MLFDDIKNWAINALGLSAIGQLVPETETQTSDGQHALYITAISAVDTASVLQCWRIDEPFIASRQKGIVGASVMQLAANSTTSLVTIPSKFDGGMHVAPALQYVIFLTGAARLSIPGSLDHQSILIQGGTSDSIIFVADTAEVSASGHRTQYPSDEETLAIAIKVASMPKHSVLYHGPCAWQEKAHARDEL